MSLIGHAAAISVSVRQPMVAMNIKASGVINRKTRATRYTPAATIVAACISALTGVGPAIASGNQTCNGNWALLPIAPQNSPIPMIVANDQPNSENVLAKIPLSAACCSAKVAAAWSKSNV